jgi:hypothetical protein
MLKALTKENVAIIFAGIFVGSVLFWFAVSEDKKQKIDESYLAGIDVNDRENYCSATAGTKGNMPPGVVGLVFEPHAGPLSATVNFPDGNMGNRSFTVIRENEPFLTYVNKHPRMCSQPFTNEPIYMDEI